MYPVVSSPPSNRPCSPPSPFVLTSLSPSLRKLTVLPQHWKRDWVRPTSLTGKPGSYKVLKWVLDTSSAPQEGTLEEVAAALKVVTSGEAFDEPTSGTATPAEGAGSRTQQLVAQASAVSVATSVASTPDLSPVPTNPSKPTTGPPQDSGAASGPPTVLELAQLPLDGLVDVEMGEVTFVEDEVQLAQEAVEGMQADA